MRTITNISCIGAGLIGQGWATQFCSSGYDLVVYDVNAAILETTLGQIKSNLMFLETHELLYQGEAAAALEKIVGARKNGQVGRPVVVCCRRRRPLSLILKSKDPALVSLWGSNKGERCLSNKST